MEKSPIDNLITPNGVAQTDEEKVEALADSLEQQFKENPTLNYNTELEVNNTVSNFRNNTVINPPSYTILPSEVTELIKKIKIKKAPGIDGISNKMVKNLPTKTIIEITHIINAVHAIQHFPQSWKTANVIPIYKTGKDSTAPSSYRPISLLPILSKITEKTILRQLNTHLYDNNILIPEQHGFRTQLSTTHQLYRVIDKIADGLNRKKSTGAVFLDIEKAFDRVWIKGLLFKLIKINTPSHIIKIIDSYLNNRHFSIVVNNTFSTYRKTLAGVVQGSILGPVLFNLYVNDFPKYQSNALCMYADDTAILHSSKSFAMVSLSINHHLLLVEQWLKNWKIKINIDKTVAVMFSYRPNKCPKLKFFGQPIPWSDDVKYLGIHLEKRLTFKKHVKYIQNRFRKIKYKLYPLIKRGSPLSTQNKLIIYKAYLRPIITYAIPVWGFLAKTNFDKLEILQSFAVRQIVEARWFFRNKDIYRALNLPTLREFAIKLSQKFYDSPILGENQSFTTIPPYNCEDNKRRPQKILNILNDQD